MKNTYYVALWIAFMVLAHNFSGCGSRKDQPPVPPVQAPAAPQALPELEQNKFPAESKLPQPDYSYKPLPEEKAARPTDAEPTPLVD